MAIPLHAADSAAFVLVHSNSNMMAVIRIYDAAGNHRDARAEGRFQRTMSASAMRRSKKKREKSRDQILHGRVEDLAKRVELDKRHLDRLARKIRKGITARKTVR